MTPGKTLVSPPIEINREELIEFSAKWDPMPFHVDEDAGIKAFGSITAPGIYMLAIKQQLIHQLPTMAVIASLGYENVRFQEPLRPGDIVVLHLEWISRRLSKSKPDRGIVTIQLSLINQSNQVVMTLLDSVLAYRRSLATLVAQH